MHLLGKRQKTVVEITFDRNVTGYRQTLAAQLRGGVLRMFPDSRFHQHDPDGGFIYRYPQVQYQWLHHKGIILGWMDAAQEMLSLPWLDMAISLNGENAASDKITLNPESAAFGISEALIHYRFTTPVLLFNQKNHSKYKGLRFSEKLYEQDRLLTAQILVALRGLNIHFSDRLFATFTELKTVPCNFKGQQLTGIKGRFASNAALPRDFAFGHAVSHGYGWIAPINKTNDHES